MNGYSEDATHEFARRRAEGKFMASKTLKELRALARARGLKGYSKLTRDELERLLAKTAGPKSSAATDASRQTAPAKKPARPEAKSSRPKPKTARPAGRKIAAAGVPPRAVTPYASVAAGAPERSPMSSPEERVESAKFATVMPGAIEPPAVSTDLDEDIEKLPPVTEPTLCLLPQKPGVMHGYWVIPPNSTPKLESLKLRLGRIVGDAYEILDEIALPLERGHWYFHLDEAADMGAVYLQLGYYEPDGRFVTATRRGIARIPSLYASERTDRLWWLSEEQFRTMYLRAGGFVQGARLGWTASISSPSGAAAPRAPSSERLAWPGGVSSRKM